MGDLRDPAAILGANPAFAEEQRVADNFFRISLRAGDSPYLLRMYPFAVFEVEGESLDEALVSSLDVPAVGTTPFSYFQPLLILTNKCNLACEYCYAYQGSYGLPAVSMAAETVDATVRFLEATIRDRYAPHVPEGSEHELGLICFGGEPLVALELVRRAWEGLNKTCDELSSSFASLFRPLLTVNTNAYDVNAGAMQLFEEMRGRSEVVVSFDGWLHDRSRRTRAGDATADRVLANLRSLARAGIDVSVTSCVLPEAVDNPSRTLGALSEVYESGIPVNLSFIRGPLSPVQGRAAYPGRIERAYDAEALDRFGESVADEIRRGMPIFSRRYRRRLFEGGYAVRCGAGLYEFAVMPDGTVYPCHNFIGPGHELGNILDAGFQIGSGSPLVDALRARSVNNLEPCSSCVLQSTCMSSFDCPAHSLHDLGSLDAVDTRFCGFARRVQGALLGSFIEERSRA